MSKAHYFCPRCKVEMKVCVGGRLHMGGNTMWCANNDCPANECVMAHGKNAENAYAMIMYKWGPKDSKDGWNPEVIDVEAQAEQTETEKPKQEIINKGIISYE